MIKIKKKVVETRLNVIGYRISSTKRPQRLFDLKALIKVLKRRRCLFKRKTTYLYQVLTISQVSFQLTINSDHYDLFTYVFKSNCLLLLFPCLCILFTYAFNLLTVKLWANF